MKVLIAYASKTGTTEKCAKLLAEHFDGPVLCDLNRDTPDIVGYDTVIIGGSIRMGELHKAAKSFIRDNHDGLIKIRAAYFICNGFPSQTDELIGKNVPEDLRKQAACIESFGGEVDAAKSKGLDKLIIKMVAKSLKENPVSILYERIPIFAEKIKKIAL